MGQIVNSPDYPLLVSHACTSSTNGVSWGKVIDSLTQYWARDQYDHAVRQPLLRAHPNEKQYKMAFKLKSEVPTKTYYYISKIIGTKNMKKNAVEMREYVHKCRVIGKQFAYFMNNEWVFDNATSLQLDGFLKQNF